MSVMAYATGLNISLGSLISAYKITKYHDFLYSLNFYLTKHLNEKNKGGKSYICTPLNVFVQDTFFF